MTITIKLPKAAEIVYAAFFLGAIFCFAIAVVGGYEADSHPIPLLTIRGNSCAATH